jgi:hypothetical protein
LGKLKSNFCCSDITFALSLKSNIEIEFFQ